MRGSQNRTLGMAFLTFGFDVPAGAMSGRQRCGVETLIAIAQAFKPLVSSVSPAPFSRASHTVLDTFYRS